MPERRPRRRPGENRERLLEAGLIEFGLFGYHGASTASIAARADVPQPHVYASFRAKRDLFVACFQASREAALERHGVDLSLHQRRVIYQAVAALGDPALHDALAEDLHELRAVAGPRFDALLLEAAESLMAPAADPA
ncbi:TetR/AcrR family transcriptional regulator [Leucobacter sp. CSA1]|uniref:TetR/AcrR family transcriptional regulator n=1 Tax=Leucobacter chromiisoli TaxID=2796471 RepID=A0A934UVM2_9MICO|nr:TetR/AcrR family transcriptional regulator [Leucobacter chromiisoli]MBK0419087.1 TetR/AcrR family transcriptional regulator [Leucobacter chromiisoli]